MNQQDLEFANYYIDCLLKKHPKAISPSYKKYGNAYNVVQTLKHDGIIERKGSNYIISSMYYHDIYKHGSLTIIKKNAHAKKRKKYQKQPFALLVKHLQVISL